MRRSRFTLGPKPTDVSPYSPSKTRTQTSPTKRSAQKKSEEVTKEEEEDFIDNDEEDDNNKSYGLPRSQLELEYTAALQEREMLLTQLSKLLEDKMTFPDE